MFDFLNTLCPRRTIVLAVGIFLFTAADVSATVVHLRSGKIIKGEIVERDDELIKIDTGYGIPITYYLDEIQTINGQSIAPAEEAEPPEVVEVPKVVEAPKVVEPAKVDEPPEVVELPEVIIPTRAVKPPKVVELPKKVEPIKPVLTKDVATLDGVDVLKKRDSPITVEPGEAARGKKTVDPGKRAESKVTARIKKDLETSEPVPAKTGPKTDFIKNSVQKVKTYLQFCGTSFRNADAYIRGKLPFIKERLNAIPVKVRRDILLLLASFTVIIYVLVCLPLMLVARKLGRKHSWLTWIPLVQCFYFIYMAKNPLWFVVFFLLPVLNIFVLLFLFVDILKLLHKPRWLVLLILLPGVNVFTLWYLAISKAGLPAPSISDTV